MNTPDSFPLPGSPEWGVMNRRRAQLCRKQVGEGLDETEAAELQDLQGRTLAAIEATCHGWCNTEGGCEQ